MNKNVLILKCAKDICGNEIGLVQSQCKLLEMNVYDDAVESLEGMADIFNKYSSKGIEFDYLCTHGNPTCFLADMGGVDNSITWKEFSTALCVHGTLKDDGIVMLGCCKGRFFQVACDIFACCNTINYIFGVKWNVGPWDLTTGFVVFIYNMEIKRAEPGFAASKATSATDYTFSSYDRDDFESNPAYINHVERLFSEQGWIDENGHWIDSDPAITQNADNDIYVNAAA